MLITIMLLIISLCEALSHGNTRAGYFGRYHLLTSWEWVANAPYDTALFYYLWMFFAFFLDVTYIIIINMLLVAKRLESTTKSKEPLEDNFLNFTQIFMSMVCLYWIATPLRFKVKELVSALSLFGLELQSQEKLLTGLLISITVLVFIINHISRKLVIQEYEKLNLLQRELLRSLLYTCIITCIALCIMFLLIYIL